MYGKVMSACLQGIEGQTIEVEVDISSGLPQINLVGLPDSAVRESVERVRSAIKNCGFTFPMDRITVNLAPADLRKEGSSFDLAIALGILITTGQVPMDNFQTTVLVGELALDGTLRPIPGVLSMVHAAKRIGMNRVCLPTANAAEAALISDMQVCVVRNLSDFKRWDELSLNEFIYNETTPKKNENSTFYTDANAADDYADVSGQHQVKRAMMIAAAGMHNILLIGPPGTGKTMLVKRMSSILPAMSDKEALEVTKIYSASGKLLDRTSLMRKRPFRAPHHTISAAGLVGGGTVPKPGEVSLSHRGILFLDELPEFTRNALEVLRQPLEERYVTIARARAVYTFPSHFILAAAMNPCPCGYWGSETEANRCTCSPLKIIQYRSKISGPLLDRIDLHVEVPKPSYTQLKEQSNPLSSNDMFEGVRIAHDRQQKRYTGTGIQYNNELGGKMLRQLCRLTSEGDILLSASFESLGLSVRAHDRILRLALTIADLEQSDIILPEHVAEAIQYRNLDKKHAVQESF
ncbi:YifB family Mg chelatase-like AAA ATPase [Paenibacillus sp. SYP-B3998]|uniref:YifB family Mg chelatase-like AAA ATPase n=1 Tax=Paenibacillus sp. SYP-B3998 TaxID=2678564 RepID=A0A6G3ZVB1_9BACL|nr:YifB family Mg chelatase-like AAA ATPase [Paenibacillus sp. SYP-B3998]NEW05529.1 YifB family Mg chelatase-like AAA ATPase [Paenibacillus sp. SYP-B3998]